MPPKQRGSVTSSNNRRKSSGASTASKSEKSSKKGSAGSGRSRSPVFWGCMSDTYFYSGPLGEPVGEVTANSIVLESQRYQDHLNNWWISTYSTEGDAIWFSIFDASRSLANKVAGEETPEPMWRRVYDSRATNESPATLNHDRAMEISTDVLTREQCGEGVTVNDLCQSHEDVPKEVELYQYYWETLSPNEPPEQLVKTDWNLRYQRALDDYLFNKNATNIVAREVLDDVVRQFEEQAMNTVGTIREEMVKSISNRKIRQHPKYAQYFYEKNGILIHMCIDTKSGFYGGDQVVEKIAQNYFKSHQLFSVEGPKHLLYVPLMTQIRFNGFLFTATSIPPVSEKGCVYAAPCYGNRIETPDVVSHALSELSSALNLVEHEVTAEGQSWKTTLPLDLKVYVGTDRRMYLVNTGRLLPSLLPLKAASVQAAKSSTSPTANRLLNPMLAESLTRRVRPELLLGYKEPLNPDVAISGSHTKDDVLRSLELTEYVMGDGCTKVAGQVGLQFPVDAPLLPLVNCLLCEKEMDDEMRFVCCSHPDGCCSICAECYTKRMFEALSKETIEKRRGSSPKKEASAAHPNNQKSEGEEKEEGKKEEGTEALFISPDSSTPSADFSDVARCGNPRKSPALFPTLSSLFHINGVNLSNLPYVYYRLPTPSKFAVKHFLEVEIIARAARQLLGTKLRGCTTSEQVRGAVESFFIPLLQERTTQALKFWAKELGPEITKLFPAIVEPFSTSAIPLDLLGRRVQEVAGVYLTPASSASLTLELEKRFVEVDRVVPQCKTVRCPVLIGTEEENEKLEVGNTLEKMLLFWIGYAPEGSIEALQPFYLEGTEGLQ